MVQDTSTSHGGSFSPNIVEGYGPPFCHLGPGSPRTNEILLPTGRSSTMSATMAANCARSTPPRTIARGCRGSKTTLVGSKKGTFARAADGKGESVTVSPSKVYPHALWALGAAVWMPLSAIAEDFDEDIASGNGQVSSYALAFAPLALYGVFYLLRSTVYPKIKLGDYVFFLASIVVVGNILSILIFKVIRLRWQMRARWLQWAPTDWIFSC